MDEAANDNEFYIQDERLIERDITRSSDNPSLIVPFKVSMPNEENVYIILLRTSEPFRILMDEYAKKVDIPPYCLKFHCGRIRLRDRLTPANYSFMKGGNIICTKI